VSFFSSKFYSIRRKKILFELFLISSKYGKNNYLYIETVYLNVNLLQLVEHYIRKNSYYYKHYKKKIFKENKANLSFITEEDISFLSSLTRDNNLIRLNNKSQEFIKGIKKKRTSYVCLLPVKEVCGIEEFFLKNLYH